MKKIIFLIVVTFSALIELAAQQKIVSGVVTDSKSLPVSGASVVVKGEQIGTITKEDGSFELKITTSAKVLLITS